MPSFADLFNGGDSPRDTSTRVAPPPPPSLRGRERSRSPCRAPQPPQPPQRRPAPEVRSHMRVPMPPPVITRIRGSTSANFSPAYKTLGHLPDTLLKEGAEKVDDQYANPIHLGNATTDELLAMFYVGCGKAPNDKLDFVCKQRQWEVPRPN
jgi:hypothetical protein